MIIDISGLDKAEVLAALYNNSRPPGMGMLHYVPGDLPIEEARAYLADRVGFEGAEYLKGRVIKTNISGDTFDPWLYDRDNGEGAAARAIDALRKSKA